MAEYINRTDTAKIIRAELKKNFPGTKFSVRCTPGGSSVEVSWKDGPATNAIDRIVKPFEGSTFDGSIDLKSYVSSTYNGEEVYFGADYVMTHRLCSRIFLEVLVDAFCTHWGYDRLKVHYGGSTEDSHADLYRLGGHSVEHAFNVLLRQTDVKNAHRPYQAQESHAKKSANDWAKDAAARKAREEKARQEEAERRAKAEASKKSAERKRKEAEHVARQKFYASRKVPFYTREEALRYLRLTSTATKKDIIDTFVRRVKKAADGHGGYTEDMNLIVKAKEKALGL